MSCSLSLKSSTVSGFTDIDSPIMLPNFSLPTTAVYVVLSLLEFMKPQRSPDIGTLTARILQNNTNQKSSHSERLSISVGAISIYQVIKNRSAKLWRLFVIEIEWEAIGTASSVPTYEGVNSKRFHCTYKQIPVDEKSFIYSIYCIDFFQFSCVHSTNLVTTHMSLI